MMSFSFSLFKKRDEEQGLLPKEEGCTPTKMFNRGKVIAGSLSAGCIVYLATNKYLTDSLGESLGIGVGIGLSAITFFTVLTLAWKFAPCVLAERYQVNPGSNDTEEVEINNTTVQRL